jgi:hypothetical protein
MGKASMFSSSSTHDNSILQGTKEESKRLFVSAKQTVFTPEQKEPWYKETWRKVEQNMPKLSFRTRMTCAVVTGLFAVIFSLAGVVFAESIILFIILFTLGNFFAVLTTCFLASPLKQVKSMWGPPPRIDQIVSLAGYIFSLFVTMFFVFVYYFPIFALLAAIVQFVAFSFYTLSHLPGFTTCATGLFRLGGGLGV